MSTVRSLDVAVRANTQNFEGAMRSVQRALKATIVGMNAVAAASAGQEKSVIGMINAVAMGYATGGPWGAAIAGAGVGLGLLIGKYKELSAETDKAAKAQQKFADEMGKIAHAGFDLSQQISFIRATGREGTPDELRLQVLGGERRMTADAVAGLQKRFDETIGPERTAVTNDLVAWQKQLDDIDEEMGRLTRNISLEGEKRGLLADIDARSKAAEEAARKLREEMERVPMAVGVAADAVFALLDGIIIRGAKASEVVRSVLQGIASIGLRQGVNAAFGIATP